MAYRAKKKQIFEVQTCRQVRRVAGALVCETRDLGIKWPEWHTLIFEGQVQVDMNNVCPKDVDRPEQPFGRSGKRDTSMKS